MVFPLTSDIFCRPFNLLRVTFKTSETTSTELVLRTLFLTNNILRAHFHVHSHFHFPSALLPLISSLFPTFSLTFLSWLQRIALISAARYQVNTVSLNLIMVIDVLFYNSDESNSLNMRDSFSMQSVIEKTYPLTLHEGLLINESLDEDFFFKG